MNEDIRRKIDFEKQQMEREIKEVESRNPPRPYELSFGKAFVSGLKVFGVHLAIAAVAFLLALATDGAYLFILITACMIVFGAIFCNLLHIFQLLKRM